MEALSMKAFRILYIQLGEGPAHFVHLHISNREVANLQT